MPFKKCRVQIQGFQNMKLEPPVDMEVGVLFLDIVSREVDVPLSKLSVETREELGAALCEQSQIGEEWVFEIDHDWLIEKNVPDGAWLQDTK